MKDYFSHDYNARNDKKLSLLFMNFGLEAIGAYWCIIEMLYEEGGYLNINEYERITFELRTNDKMIDFIINKSELFQNDGIKFWSQSVLHRLELRAEKSQKARDSIYKRWDKIKNNTNVLQTNNERNTNKVKESKVKESKEKDKFTKPSKKIIYPEILEIENYFLEKGYTKEAANKFHEYYTVADWKDSKGNKVLSWKQKAQAVWFKDEYLQLQQNTENSETIKQIAKITTDYILAKKIWDTTTANKFDTTPSKFQEFTKKWIAQNTNAIIDYKQAEAKLLNDYRNVYLRQGR
jgi:hypothetical protein